MSKGGSVILRIYFVLVSFVTLMMLIFSMSDLLNIGLKTWVFTAADGPTWTTICAAPVPVEKGGVPVADCEQQKENERHSALVQKQQDAVRDLSMLLIAAPLFALHFRIVLRDWKEMRKET